MQRQRFDRVRENDLKKIFRNGKKLKSSKLLALSVVCGEKLNSPAGIGWSEIKNKEKREEEETEKGETNGRRNEQRKTVGEKTYSFPCNVSSFNQVERNIWRQKKI